jgi:hypothetical protein
MPLFSPKRVYLIVRCGILILQNQHFVRDGRGYTCQYAQIYFLRLTSHKNSLRLKVAQRWPKIPGVKVG